MEEEYFLSVGIEHHDGRVAYGGNHDAYICGLIGATCYWNRHGFTEGQRQFSLKDWPVKYEWFTYQNTEHGENSYQLDSKDYYRILFKFDTQRAMDDALPYLFSIVGEGNEDVRIKDYKFYLKETRMMELGNVY